tara:strand:+ start:708 stop:1544 length:837 start_codon:yes stop_codon:yes gene_type:complete
MKKIYDNFSQKTSKLITNEYSTSFSFSTKLLSKNIRPSIYAIYGLVRIADEIVDSFHEYDKEKLLDKLIADYQDSIENKISLNPVLNSFQEVYHKYDFEPYLVERFFDSMKMDLKSAEYTSKLYDNYIHGSAEVVGLMCLKVFVKGDKSLYDDLKHSAMKLGSAFQKVNFLRDLEFDYTTLGRTYFPNLDDNNVSTRQKEEIINDIEKDFTESLIGLKKLDKDSFLGVYVAYRYYRELLSKIKKSNLAKMKDVRIRISNIKKMALILNSAIKVNLKLV